MLKYAYAVPNLLQGNYWKLHRLRVHNEMSFSTSIIEIVNAHANWHDVIIPLLQIRRDVLKR